MTRPAMTIERAREILGDAVHRKLLAITTWSHHYIYWVTGDDTARLDGHFTADELEAIACVMRAGERKE